MELGWAREVRRFRVSVVNPGPGIPGSSSRRPHLVIEGQDFLALSLSLGEWAWPKLTWWAGVTHREDWSGWGLAKAQGKRDFSWAALHFRQWVGGLGKKALQSHSRGISLCPRVTAIITKMYEKVSGHGSPVPCSPLLLLLIQLEVAKMVGKTCVKLYTSETFKLTTTKAKTFWEVLFSSVTTKSTLRIFLSFATVTTTNLPNGLRLSVASLGSSLRCVPTMLQMESCHAGFACWPP